MVQVFELLLLRALDPDTVIWEKYVNMSTSILASEVIFKFPHQ